MLQLDGLSKAAVLDADKVNNGVWVHLESAALNDDGVPELLYLNGDTTKPQRALVRSYRCQAVKEAEAARQKSGFVKIRLAKKSERDGVIAESSILPEADRFSLLLVALDNVSAAGGIQQVDAESAKKIHGMSAYDTLVQQVRETAYDDGLYVATADTPAGNASTSAPAAKPAPASTTE